MDVDAVSGFRTLESDVVLMGIGSFLGNVHTEGTEKVIPALREQNWRCTCEKEESMDSLKKGIILLE